MSNPHMERGGITILKTAIVNFSSSNMKYKTNSSNSQRLKIAFTPPVIINYFQPK